MIRDLCPRCGRLDPWVRVPCLCRQTGSNSLSDGMVTRLRRLAFELRTQPVA